MRLPKPLAREWSATETLRPMVDAPAGLRTQLNIFGHYNNALINSLRGSWEQFLQGRHQPRFGGLGSYGYEPSYDLNQPGPEVATYNDVYVHSVIQQTDSLAPNRPVSEAVSDAFNVATDVHIKLVPLLGRYFKPAIPLLLSRTSVRGFMETIRPDMDHRQDSPFNVVDVDAKSLVNMKMLIDAGFKQVMGCPAGHLPTDETRAFLEGTTGKPYDKPMLLDFSERVEGEFNLALTQWWEALPPTEQARYGEVLYEETKHQLNGMGLERLREQRKAGPTLK